MGMITTIKEKAGLIWLTIKSLFSNDEAIREEIDKKHRKIISGIAGAAGCLQAFIAAGMIDADAPLSGILPNMIISATLIIISLRIGDR